MLKSEVISALAKALLGNEDAVRLNAALIEVLHLWDDLIDKDKVIADEDINRGFRAALVEIPGNPFYQAHFAQLHPLLDNLILNWMTATEMERAPQSGHDLTVAFIIRSDYCNFLLKCMQIVGGFEYARSAWPTVRRNWHNEGYEGYLRNLAEERAAREGTDDVQPV